MLSYHDAGRMPKSTVLGSAIALYIIAVSTAIVRTILRIYYQKSLLIDDGFLALAVLLASACLGLYVNFMDSMYLIEALTEGQMPPPGVDLLSIESQGFRLHRLSDVFLVLTWTIIFAVKFSFLFFFKALISRVRSMEFLWRGIVGITTIVWAAGCAASIVGCPYFDERSTKCAQGPELPKTIAIAAVLVTADILTDLAVIMIPVLILRKVQLRPRTKFLLSCSLCLSFVMIIVTIIRVSGLRDRHAKAIDVVWEVHWQWVEACVAITMVSLTAFRSFFIQHNSRNNSPPKRPWYAGVKAIMTGRGSEEKKEAVREWPKIPGGTITGIRTFIDGRGNEVEEDVMPLHHKQQHRQGIVVQHDLSSMSEGKSSISTGEKEHQGFV